MSCRRWRPRSGRVLFTGHSSGAALATLAAALHPPTRLLTFGSPRVGDALFATEAGPRIAASRYVDCCDVVCRLPPKPYHHLGRLHYIDRWGDLHEEPEPSFVHRDHARARLEYLRDLAWRSGNAAARDLADHAPINYVAALAA